MKPKTLILMVVAVVCGLGASYMTSRLLAEREDRPPVIEVKPPETVKLLVAKKEIGMHTYIKNPLDYFWEKELVKENLPKDAVNDVAMLKGKTLKRTIHKNEAVVPEDLNDGSPVLEVPPGHQAMGLSVTVHTAAGGFASLPGSRVDILWSRKGNNDKTSFTKTLLQNVLVLAADAAKNRSDDGNPIPASVVTLALTPADVRRVANATESGTMRLVLRIPGDNSVVKNDTTTLEQTIRGQGAIPEKVDVEDPSVPGVEPKANPKVVAKGGPKDDLKTEEPPVIPEVKRKKHVVRIRQGDKEWTQVFWLDEHNNVIPDEAEERLEAPPAPPQQPALQPPALQPPALQQPAVPQQPAVVAPGNLPKGR